MYRYARSRRLARDLFFVRHDRYKSYTPSKVNGRFYIDDDLDPGATVVLDGGGRSRGDRSSGDLDDSFSGRRGSFDSEYDNNNSNNGRHISSNNNSNNSAVYNPIGR